MRITYVVTLVIEKQWLVRLSNDHSILIASKFNSIRFTVVCRDSKTKTHTRQGNQSSRGTELTTASLFLFTTVSVLSLFVLVCHWSGTLYNGVIFAIKTMISIRICGIQIDTQWVTRQSVMSGEIDTKKQEYQWKIETIICWIKQSHCLS